MKKVAFYTLGCKLNFSETSTISRLFEEEGYQKVAFEEKADIFVINTCSVTENADKKCRQIVKSAKKNSPDSFVVIIGCFAQLKPKEISEIPGVDAVLGAAEKFKLLEHLKGFEKQKEAIVCASEISNATEFNNAYSIADRTRTFLKVQDGCNYGCAFCTIPLARGKSRSDTIENILKSAHEIAQTEVKEVVLTGVNIGDFGVQDGRRKERFLELIQTLDEVEGIERYRISSIEPNLLNNQIIEFVAKSKRFVPHFHIPLQSGSNKILKLMNRRYLRELYVERVAKIKQEMPDACIGVDVITGFPGETHEDFLDTYNFINELPVSYLHVFTYSERANTHAVEMDGVVPKKERNERSNMLRILSEKKKHAFYESQLGKAFSVLLENDVKEGYMFGFTENYLKVKLPFQEDLVNQVRLVKMEAVNEEGTMDVLESVVV
ncbi:tRNA (N(6)-L-threonylcarbamoyladenosine(37)-C(2))-methylthiotransferase MtaB [Reichenbachiella carrageenanivorans]|uniref:tRNA (N(6)-L-threonylcarbamoyladenosine(37)-C(2))-methylthiotransferase MtaB n=1 Tax=Reichenbachiella carrageenanivorans TaxID=2979869 RepID=A0ABY6CX26_9BACT|nr:tRNA (N(6)-L-threonylcarbamoyladenosine(37)-C(2))-methylthiotransferase MtaB [Reichenbachiella carrageenanivorans]UXX78481.1 tRNA (N(6)-L-threonylcarbamoyladenosine(37)-C(2))-methylthiotransferase MtaB [Reichenbachiella carrageenanivorans]